jgi:hypothetical protein
MRGILNNTIKSFVTLKKLMKLTTFLKGCKVVFFAYILNQALIYQHYIVQLLTCYRICGFSFFFFGEK